LLEVRGISKSFPGVRALEDVHFAADGGEVVAVIGENGAGKSTLMKILGGVHAPDTGEILLDGQRITLRNPGEALARGIRVIYQELSVLDNLDIAGNIFLGREPRGFGGLLASRTMRQRAAEILKRVGLARKPTDLVADLSIAERQLVEIARALSIDVRLLILDEPTSSLTLDETNRLLDLIRELKASGVTVLYISHRLDEVKAIADRVVALKDGQNAGELDRDAVTHDAMVRMMVGRDLDRSSVPSGAKLGEVRLKLSGVRTQRFPSQSVDFEIHAGEILGMAGLVGAGRSELARAVFGIDRFAGGSVLVDGSAVTLRSGREAIEAGIYLVPEDRRGAGLIVEMSVQENTTLPALREYARAGIIDRDAETQVTRERSERFRVKTATLGTSVSTLSGGNQQKVVLARWVPMHPKVMIFDEPTRGIDVGAKAEIYAEMRALAREGVAIWMISSDMEEIFSVSDRIAVLSEGRVGGYLSREEASEEAVMKLAVGEGR
jgi:ribose transport system ATP-binding protein